ncbi:unnamed protein product [Ceratitis capitata]|uniref:(Mediterranean fruit fly) hypothetical protein n=1 Tax=Ceratitis capitata TaxID=7213 RepID=A0A811UDW5_CERCA|nr:unnamed protein product [Ceratitis capitata]
MPIYHNNSSTGKRYISNACIGVYKRYHICNEQPCPAAIADFRAVQCGAFNEVDFQGHKYTWEPYIKEDAECELNCKPLGMKYFATLNSSVVDGTPCFRPAEYFRSNYRQRAMCVDGVCKSNNKNTTQITVLEVDIFLLLKYFLKQYFFANSSFTHSRPYDVSQESPSEGIKTQAKNWRRSSAGNRFSGYKAPNMYWHNKNPFLPDFKISTISGSGCGFNLPCDRTLCTYIWETLSELSLDPNLYILKFEGTDNRLVEH